MDVAFGLDTTGGPTQGGHRKTSHPHALSTRPRPPPHAPQYRSSRMGPQPPPSSSPPSAPASSSSSSSDAATLVQESLDKLALSVFNAVLEVSRAQGQTNEGGHRAKASQLGLEIGTVLREIEEAIETLPVIPPPAGGPGEHANSVVATRKRLKELQAEYERVHHELEETVSEAEKMSQKLRSTLINKK